MQTLVMLCATSETIKRQESRVKETFVWRETSSEILDYIQKDEFQHEFHLSFFDKFIDIDLSKLISMKNIVGIDICYSDEQNQHLKHDKIHFTSIDQCRKRWSFIAEKQDVIRAAQLDSSQFYPRLVLTVNDLLLTLNNKDSCIFSLSDAIFSSCLSIRIISMFCQREIFFFTPVKRLTEI